MWTGRIMLESLQHADNAFVTLTYSDDKLPDLHSLKPKHVQDWLKRLREKIAPSRIRYYVVGEYGDETHRPHYHAALFGFPSCWNGQTVGERCCDQCELVRTTWQHGNIFLGTLEAESAQYICGYVTKKMTSKYDERLEGRHPEFCRMSLRPGIGADAMHEVASQLMKFNLDTSQGDVPSSLRFGSRSLPIGRYLRGRLREMIGKDAKAPQETLDKIAEEMLPLLEASKTDKENVSLRSQVIAAGCQAVANMEARRKIFTKGKSL